MLYAQRFASAGWWLSIVVCIAGANVGHAGDEELTLVYNLPYSTASKSCTLDLAVPKAPAERPRPTIVVIHGGGWIEGDKSSFSSPQHRTPGNILDFARLGFVAITINYRLSGEAPFPAALDDCRCAVRWLRAHASEYRIDSENIGAYGNSAGGHLALLLGLVPEAKDLAATEQFREHSSQVQSVVSDSGPLDLHYQQGDALWGVIEKFMGGPPAGSREASYRAASPITYVSAKTPPLLLIYGEIDNQVSVRTADQFVAALSNAGAKDVSYFRLAEVDHCPYSLIRVPFLRPVVDEFFSRTLTLTPPVR